MARKDKTIEKVEETSGIPLVVPEVVVADSQEVPEINDNVAVNEAGNNQDMKKVQDLKKTVVGVLCDYCKRKHEKTFNAVGINHEPFSPGGKAQLMFDNLCEQPRKPLFVPFLIGEKYGAVADICLNGLKINILKGVYVEVPQQVAEIMMESLNQTAMAPDMLKTFNKQAGEYRSAKLDLRDDAHRSRLNA